jgi:hypothetical protein
MVHGVEKTPLEAMGGNLGGASHQMGWSGEARGPRGGATCSAALTFVPGRAAGAVFFFPGGSLRDKWLDRTGRVCRSWARKKNKKGAPLEYELQHHVS